MSNAMSAEAQKQTTVNVPLSKHMDEWINDRTRDTFGHKTRSRALVVREILEEAMHRESERHAEANA